MKAMHRWALYAVAATATGTGMVYVDRPNHDLLPAVAAHPAPSKPEPIRNVVAGWTLPRREIAAVSADPFESAEAPAAEPARFSERSSPAEAALPATAPPLPFSYVGQWMEKGVAVAFLTTPQGINVAARLGATLEGDYRVERIDEQGMTLLYLPLNTRQTLSFAEARSTPAATVPAAVHSPADSAGTEETN